jgi:hypothetical protein
LCLIENNLNTDNSEDSIFVNILKILNIFLTEVMFELIVFEKIETYLQNNISLVKNINKKMKI